MSQITYERQMMQMAWEIPDHPDIRRAERTGYVTGEPVEPCCPVCGSNCCMIYKNEDEVVGCDECISTADAWEESKCFPERE